MFNRNQAGDETNLSKESLSPVQCFKCLSCTKIGLRIMKTKCISKLPSTTVDGLFSINFIVLSFSLYSQVIKSI